MTLCKVPRTTLRVTLGQHYFKGNETLTGYHFKLQAMINQSAGCFSVLVHCITKISCGDQKDYNLNGDIFVRTCSEV